MYYNFKRALGVALAMYLTTFIIGIVAGIVTGQDMSSMEILSDWFWYVGMIAAVVCSVLFAIWYFKDKNITLSAKSGFYFGLTTVVVSFILDLALFSLGNSQGAEVELMDYYGNVRFWFILLLVLLASSAVGAKKSKSSKAQ